MDRYRMTLGFLVMLLAAAWWSAAPGQSTATVAGINVSGPQAGQVYSEDFEAGTPKNWEFFGGAGIVQSGQGNVLAFSADGIAAWDVQPGGNFTLSLRIRQGGGAPEILLSHTGDPPDEEYYVVRLFPDEAEIAKFIGSQQTSLGAVGGKGIGAGTWTSVEVTMSGNGQSIAVSVGGQPLLSAQDAQPLKPGIVAFRGFGGGTEIDDLVITLGSTSAAPAVQPKAAQ